MLTVTDLQCIRGYNHLFNSLSISLSAGELLEVRGDNGRGKSSLIKILAGLLQPLAGKILWNGASITENLEDWHEKIAYLGHKSGLNDSLTPFENIQFWLQLNSIPHTIASISEILEDFVLGAFAQSPSRVLSAGQNRRVALARVLLSQKLIWLLDEPFTALDRNAILFFSKHIIGHCQAGGIVVMSSHQSGLLLNGYSRKLRLERGNHVLV